ncbi:MAG: NAD-dependent epimerase/dehydratase family protein [Verrucomicrobiota bacterium]
MKPYENKLVLVTGGTGFVGGRLVERLVLEEKARVRVLVRNWTRAVWVSRVDAELVEGDLTDLPSVREAAKGVDYVFHCSSSGNSPESYRRTNVDGTRNLLDALASQSLSRLVFLSSIAVHGPNPADGMNEQSPMAPGANAYSQSKIEAELLLLQRWRDQKTPITILRPTFIWGPRSHLFTIRQLKEMRHGTFAHVDEGRGSCHAIYVDNLVDSMLLAGLKPEAVGEAFLVTDGLDITWGDFFGYYQQWLKLDKQPSINSRSQVVRNGARLADWLDECLVRFSGNPAPFWRRAVRRSLRIVRDQLRACHYPRLWDLEKFARRGHVNIGKARRLLGYAPRYDLAAGMAETERWVRDQMEEVFGSIKNH